MAVITLSASIDLDDIEDDDIRDEYEKRSLDYYAPQIREMYEYFKLGKNDKAMEIAKSMAQDLTGGIL